MDLHTYASDVLRREAASRRVTGTSMARRGHRTQSWVSNRMTGKVVMNMDDLSMFATLLDIPVSSFVPAELPCRKP